MQCSWGGWRQIKFPNKETTKGTDWDYMDRSDGDDDDDVDDNGDVDDDTDGQVLRW